MFARSGDITAPCGVPTVVRDRFPSSDTPALSHFLIRRSIRGSAMRWVRYFNNHSCEIVSKKTRQISIQNPVDLAALKSNTHRIQRIMLAAARSESVDETEKVHLVDHLQNPSHRSCLLYTS